MMKTVICVACFVMCLACRTQPPPTTSVSASNSIPVNVGAGDDKRVHRDFRIHARGESIVVIVYRSNDPDATPVETDTLMLGTMRELIRELRRIQDPHH